jgi:hypothetical protein
MNMEVDYAKGFTATPKDHRLLISAFLMKLELTAPDKEVYVEFSNPKNSISRQMQKFYFSYLVESVKQWNIKTGVFCYEDLPNEDGEKVDLTITDNDEIDHILREHFFYKKIVVGKKITKLPKTLKMNKANMKECCEYFDTLIRFFSDKGLFIETYDFN